ncbi:MerR family transcriptional regulator [Desulfopila sp. IMCC35008]|uniref:MerR family transcriptional regulator n=1 Tax=Desulfopila sp. IMCC35008 TaxID=2653858 RepID=UPI0013D180D5|nr:MerR family transcriptional regulator [Desulfopila sp. IMCC35008]
MANKETATLKKEMTFTISKLAGKFGLSRSTLLYYDAQGLLSPAGHQQGEYRIYGEYEFKRLERICMYRDAGISLKAIKKILDIPDTDFTEILSKRFEELNKEMRKLQDQQKIIADLLQNQKLLKKPKKMNKQMWSSILKASGLSEEGMRNWHITFEKEAPEQHKVFLQYLQISDDEIELIKSWAVDPSTNP